MDKNSSQSDFSKIFAHYGRNEIWVLPANPEINKGFVSNSQDNTMFVGNGMKKNSTLPYAIV
jgi:hypothetical protein